MKLQTIIEAKKKQDKPVFKETDPQLPFPNDTITAIKKRANVFAKDLTSEWDSAIEMLDAVLIELKVPKPPAYLRKRWEQYQELLGFAVENLHDARGFGGHWNDVIK